MSLIELEKEIKKYKNLKDASFLQRFFKTGKGEYGEGDIFYGIRNPQSKIIARKFKDLFLEDCKKALHSKIHEERLISLFILVNQFQKAKKDPAKQKEIFNLYLRNAKRVNNWDLVDLSAPKISGPYLLSQDRKILYKLAKSANLWERRIAIMSTYAFIRNNDFTDTFALAKILLNDKHDLIHKAVGWMLREIGKRDLAQEEAFLKKYYKQMPRTMLRYAIEKFSEQKRLMYLRKIPPK
ncbi:MAG: DNA alkylation repair protein [Patescibacteria group bacterium]|jgi:3-methyladenine DNA glycosylase AlkD